jgi:periplasmic protein TonB
MAYADQQMSSNRIYAGIVVALIHAFVGYALVTGLAYSAVKQLVKKVTTVDVKEEEKPKEPPPPPPKPKDVPPPPVAPPVQINVSVTPPQIQTVQTPPPPAPIFVTAAPPPPAPRFAAKGPSPKGSAQSWVSTDDYPSRSLNSGKHGTVRLRLAVGTDGRVSDCQIIGSSGTPELDDTSCSLLRKRGKFNPATDGDGNVTSGNFSYSFTWKIPVDE